MASDEASAKPWKPEMCLLVLDPSTSHCFYDVQYDKGEKSKRKMRGRQAASGVGPLEMVMPALPDWLFNNRSLELVGFMQRKMASDESLSRYISGYGRSVATEIKAGSNRIFRDPQGPDLRLAKEETETLLITL